MEGLSPTGRLPNPKVSSHLISEGAPQPQPARPADRHVEPCHRGVLFLPYRQQVVDVGHQRVEERHHKGQHQQDGFLLPLITTLRSVVLLNLVSRYQSECMAASSLVPVGRVTNAYARRRGAMGLPLSPRAALPSWPSTSACYIRAGDPMVRGSTHHVHVL